MRRGLELAHGGQRLCTRAGGVDREALEAQGHRHDVGDVRLVVDHEHAVGFRALAHVRDYRRGCLEFPVSSLGSSADSGAEGGGELDDHVDEAGGAEGAAEPVDAF